MNAIKEGAKLNHRWFKRKKDRIYGYLQKQIISPMNSIEKIEEIISLAIKIEERRDDLAYGVVSSEKVLQEEINLFFKMKELTGWKT